jgi:hypothetical protein
MLTRFGNKPSEALPGLYDVVYTTGLYNGRELSFRETVLTGVHDYDVDKITDALNVAYNFGYRHAIERAKDTLILSSGLDKLKSLTVTEEFTMGCGEDGGGVDEQ